MNPLQNVVIAGACALGAAALASPAAAASKTSSSGATVGGYSMNDIQTVDRRGGGGWGGRGFGGGRSFGGARSFGGGRSWGGGRGFGGRGWNGGRYAWRGGGYRGYRGGYGYRRGYGGYYAAGILGLGLGAALASPYYYDDYYDGGYGDYDGYYRSGYGYAPRRAYYGAECQVISKRRDARGRLVRVIRYRPC